MSIIVIPRGGFGNILFTILAGFSFSKKSGLPVYFLTHYVDQRKNIREYKLFKNLPFVSSLPKINIVFRENGFGFTEFPPITRATYLFDGYFQSWKYSLPYIPEIKNLLFNQVPELVEEAKNIVSQINSNNNPLICLHIRRGDYLKLQNFHPVQSLEYYRQSIQTITDRVGEAKILVFSDDIPFAAQHFGCYTLIDKDVELSFILMSMCDHFIISNSSLSLLGYYFGCKPESLLCMPKNWFGRDGPKVDFNDLIPFPNNTFLLG